MLIALLVPMVLAVLAFAWILLRAAIARRAWPSLEGVVLGAITNFFDTLGIGSFAPTTAWFKFRKLVPDRLIPPTMLVGHGLPTMAQSIIFLALLGVMVDPVLLVGCALSVLMGGLLGAPLVAKARVWIVQLVVAIALLVAAFFYALTNLDLMPGGGTAASLPILLTIVAIVANFIFGILLNFGIGNFARAGNYPAGIRISPDGRFLYASNRGHDSIVAFAVDEASGRLSLAGFTPCGGAWPRDIRLTPSGRHLFSANQNGDCVAILARDEATGRLTDTRRPIEVGTPMCVRMTG